MRDHLKLAHDFREEAKRLQLITPDWHYAEGSFFSFYLNSGDIIVPDPTPARLLSVVLLARKHAHFSFAGEHNALLQSGARREDIETGKVRWDSPYPRHPSYLSLREWLTESGIDMEQVLKAVSLVFCETED